MTAPILPTMLLAAWEDLNRVLRGLTEQEGSLRLGGGSAFSWTAAHLANQLDGYLNVRLQNRDPHPLIGQPVFRFGGPGKPGDWAAIQQGIQEVHERARPFLESLSEADMERSVPYQGSLAPLQERGSVTVRYSLARIVLHHYYHIGEIATKRVLLGHEVGDYPGMLLELL